jgi:hypothetical protein
MKRPVFLVGCPRSGTTLLYSMLIAAGGFAAYRKETFFYVVAKRYAKLHRAAAKERFRRELLAGHLGRVRGLDVAPLIARVVALCSTVNEVQPRLLDEITTSQGMERWVEATPHHVLHMADIARAVPDALFVHVIRDGRDCAISTAQKGWAPALPFDDKSDVSAAAVYWEWMVRAGRSYGAAHPAAYREIRFEKLVADPRAELKELGAFIDHDLDYDWILQHPVHALVTPNTSFRSERGRPEFAPVNRWKHPDSAERVRRCEELVGPYLRELGYPLSDAGSTRPTRAAARIKRSVYLTYFSAKHWLKVRSPLGRFMTSADAWAAPPREDEAPVAGIPTRASAAADPSSLTMTP